MAAKSVKTFSLSNEEKSNLQFRRSVLDYLKTIIEQDVQMYLEIYVKKRLGLNQDDKISEIDFTAGEIRVEPGDSKITLPTNEEVTKITSNTKSS